MSEPLTRTLAELPLAEPSPARAERIRERCRAQLARNAASSHGEVRRHGTAQVWQPLVVVLGFAYLIQVVVQVFRVYSLR